jgi:hypothetical protein
VKRLTQIIDPMVIGQDRTLLRRNFMPGNEMHDEITFDEFMVAYAIPESATSVSNPMTCVTSNRRANFARWERGALRWLAFSTFRDAGKDGPRLTGLGRFQLGFM